MPKSLPVPIGETQLRLPQAGRIRLGVKDNTKQGRHAISTFRLTSQKASYLETVAGIYGGTVAPWSDPKSADRFEVITETDELAVILPQDALTRWYELWAGKGLVRRCDAETCTRTVPGPDGPEYVTEPCICIAEWDRQCDPKLRLSVILPEVDTIRTWRLDTGGQNAWEEMPGVVQVIEQVQGKGLFRATLRLEKRVLPGRHFVVPVLDLGVSMDELMAGDSRLAGLSRAPLVAPRPELRAGPGGDVGLDVIEAEVVEDVDPTIARAWMDNLKGPRKAQALMRARELAEEMGEPVPTTAAAVTPAVINRLMHEMKPEEDA
jgi:hypothetical protein